MERKGVSQVLALIVAASILMMTALTVIMLAQGSLSDFGSSVNEGSCISSIKTECSVTGQAEIGVPAACTTNGEIPSAIDNAINNEPDIMVVSSATSGTQISCGSNQ